MTNYDGTECPSPVEWLRAERDAAESALASAEAEIQSWRESNARGAEQCTAYAAEIARLRDENMRGFNAHEQTKADLQAARAAAEQVGDQWRAAESALEQTKARAECADTQWAHSQAQHYAWMQLAQSNEAMWLAFEARAKALEQAIDAAVKELEKAHHDSMQCKVVNTIWRAMSALRAARLERLNTWNETEGTTDGLVSICQDTAACLSSAPAPVAALTLPPDGYEGMVGGRDLPRPASAPVAAPSLPWLDEEGCIVPYPPEQLAPVAAPCAGCAEHEQTKARVAELCRGQENLRNAIRSAEQRELAACAEADELRAGCAEAIGLCNVGAALAAKYEQAIDAAVVELESMREPMGCIKRALSALRAARSKP